MLKEYLKSPYPFFEEILQKLWIVLGVSIFVVIFLWVFQPFGIDEFSSSSKQLFIVGSGLVCFAILAANHFLLTSVFSNFLKEEGWTIGKHILWLWWQLVSVGLGNYVFAIAGGFVTSGWLSFLFIILVTLAIGILPIAISVLISHLILYKRRLKTAERVSKQIQEKEDGSTEPLILTSETGSEKIECDAGDFLYAESRDNYAYVCYTQKGETKRIMLRSTLKRIEDQIYVSWILRCHRSYIVNLQKVKSVSGNAQGYKLKVERVDFPIPVARSRHNRVLGTLESL